MSAHLPGRTFDPWVLTRKASGHDADGFPLTGTITVATGRGTCTVASAKAQAIAAQAGQRLDATLVTTSGADFRPGDSLTCRGKTWRVESVQDVRVHRRVFLASPERATGGA